MHKRPELLWKKESTKNNAFYVDIFNGVRSMDIYDAINESNSNQKFCYLPKKDSKLSIKYREEGNQFYVRKNYKKAIEMYNKSLCYAEINTENVSFAFGNRSLCFVEMKMYGQGLTDIQLAKDANYPERLMHKLDNRKATCLEKIEGENRQTSNFPKLSFDADSEISSIANILKIKQNDQYGRHIVTESDIEIEQTVLIEKPLSDVLIGSEYSRCAHCLKENMNFVACKKCVNAMFCNENCENNPYHRYECDMFKLFGWETDGYFRNMLQFIVRLVLTGVTLTSILNVDELMEVVAGCINASEANKIIIAEDTIRSKFETLVQLSCFISTEKELYDISIQMACVAYDLLLECAEIRQLFSTVTYRRFLMHLTIHLSGIFKTNRQSLAEINSFSIMGDSVEHFGLAIYNLRSYLNHACTPNVVCLSYDNVSVCKAIKPIKKGEQLFIDYMETDLDTRRTVRQGQLKAIYGFSCGCELCLLSGETLTSTVLMKSDSDYVFVERNFRSVMITRNQNVLRAMKEKSIKFLKKWGRSKPCQELLLVQQHLTVFLQLLRQNDNN